MFTMQKYKIYFNNKVNLQLFFLLNKITYFYKMKTSLQILQNLISWLSKFLEEQTHSKKDIKDFILWLNHKLFNKNISNKKDEDNSVLDMELTHLLISQSKHYKAYSKKALINSKLSTHDEFSFLYHLSVTDSYRKMELINMHLLEAPSGIEVLKRLLKQGLIDEFDDLEDKRAKRIKISSKGRKELERSLKNMNIVFETMPAKLELNEKIHLISILRELNNYHVNNTKEFSFDK